jgi:ribose transport system ATP-binding protein
MADLPTESQATQAPPPSEESTLPRLRMIDMVKDFPGVRALDHVTFEVRAGEIMGLVGENGAGKSTLAKILSGAYRPDSGRVILNGREANINVPADALKLGVRVIYQEVDLVPALSVKENIFLGRMPTRRGLLDKRGMTREARRVLGEVGFDIDPDVELGKLGVARRHIVAIAQALTSPVQVLVLDEPSAVIPEKDMRTLYDLLHHLARQGTAIVYISHHLQEVLDIADRITVLKDGARVGVVRSTEVDEQTLANMMVGRDLEDYYPERRQRIGDVALQVEGLSTEGLVTQDIHDINFTLRKGEILGIYGLVGSGRTELAKTLFGVTPYKSGRILIEGKEVTVHSPAQAIALGLALLVEDRKDEGLVLDANVTANITMANYAGISRSGWILAQREKSVAQEYTDKLHIKTPSLQTVTKSLSGGNQQKVVLAKWLFRQAKILVFDEPTRGIDVGAKAEIYQLMNELVNQGVAVIMISSELNEILGMADHVIVMRQGRIAGEVSSEEATEERLVSIAMGVERHDASE